jgi:hypothetical protein
MVKLISISEALEIAEQYPSGPKTLPGVLYSGKRVGFLQRDKDGIHWKIQSKNFRSYLHKLNNCPHAIAKKLGISDGSFAYTMLKLQIKPAVWKNIKYIERNDVRKIKRFYQRKINRKGNKTQG